MPTVTLDLAEMQALQRAEAVAWEVSGKKIADLEAQLASAKLADNTGLLLQLAQGIVAAARIASQAVQYSPHYANENWPWVELRTYANALIACPIADDDNRTIAKALLEIADEHARVMGGFAVERATRDAADRAQLAQGIVTAAE